MGKNVYTVSESENGLRLDNFLKDRSGLSRAEVQKWIKEGGAILSPDKMIRPNYHVRTGDEIFFTWEEKKELEIIPQDIPIDILYEDDDMMVINKARGMVIHPGSGNPDHTLVNALLYHCGPKLFEACEDPLRPGIVHRLDKDTSGVMVVAKSARAFPVLKEEIATHEAQRIYVALVHGQMEGNAGVIRFPLGRSTKDRMKWDVQPKTGKPAVTHFRVLEFMPHYSWIECRLETGRTHQIRVHMAHIGHPVVNDPLYGWKKDAFPIEGQALHSRFLDLHHPVTGEAMHFEAPVPEDMLRCLEIAGKDEL
ncbi:RluA family pseudouridine synthase [Dialister hominis]|jgi:23S rRNA pseudouridine1911/1915/1917 synthase|uniref:RluA family pseudouridine synthase n=1 Tax=Dialister hominis TaxID=2582419 RepID=UPI0026601966|nr:RluA family pseudouridine synthase [uncultured Dialister sp.]